MSYRNDNGYGGASRKYRSPIDWEFVGIIAFVAAIVLGIVGSIAWAVTWSNTTGTSASCVVKDKTTSSKGKGGTEYRIYTENCGVLAVGDDIAKGSWDSADRYSGIEVGKTYNFDTVGWRMPVASSFPNILKYSEVK